MSKLCRTVFLFTAYQNGGAYTKNMQKLPMPVTSHTCPLYLMASMFCPDDNWSIQCADLEWVIIRGPSFSIWHQCCLCSCMYIVNMAQYRCISPDRVQVLEAGLETKFNLLCMEWWYSPQYLKILLYGITLVVSIRYIILKQLANYCRCKDHCEISCAHYTTM